jgi:predicted metal-dependent hydrolase
MHPLLRFTLDLFEDKKPLAEVEIAPPLTALTAVSEFRHPKANRETRLCNTLVAYEFKRSKRRTIGFSVGSQGLVVSAPNWVALKEVENALQEKALWIIKKLGDTQVRHQWLKSNRIEWCDGTTLPYLGTPMSVVLDPSHSGRAGRAMLLPDRASPTLQLGLSNSATPDQIRDATQVWLMKVAQQRFIERLDHFAPQLQVKWLKLSLSNAATRWGSARVDGAIRLNWRLIHFAPPVIDYVVAHELSHLREMNHSPRFWDTVRTVVPDYARLRKQLKEDVLPRWL